MTEVTKIEQAAPDAAPQGASASDPMVSMIERIAMTPDLPIERLEKMLDMKERMERKDAQAQHAAAFARASADFPAIPMNGKGHNNMPYATLKDIIAKTRPVLSQHGLALNFAVETSDTIRVTARLSHTSGHIETVSIDLPRDTSGSKNNVQAVGSSQTYGQRYAAQAILGLSLGEDTEDDGRAAAGNTIDADQYRELRGLVEKAGIPEETVCKAAGVEMLEMLPVPQFEAVKKRLNLTIQNKEQSNG